MPYYSRLCHLGRSDLLKNHVVGQTGIWAYTLYTDAAIQQLGLTGFCQKTRQVLDACPPRMVESPYDGCLTPLSEAGGAKPVESAINALSRSMSVSSQPVQSSSALPTWAAWASSLVNGAVGDYLAERQNGLAIDMGFYHRGRPLPLLPGALLMAHPQPTAKICILVHGLGCHEGTWTYSDDADPDRETSYGALLQSELGYTPFFVRYNTGLALAANGALLSTLIDDLMGCYPARVEEITLIGHSMGGLVLHSACHQAVEQQAGWVERVSRVFYLGTPHDGAHLARLAHTATAVLHAVPHPITRLIGAIFDWRSQGVKDLSFGHSAARIEPTYQQPAPWLPQARHYLIAGALTDDPQHWATQLFGDGLVSAPRSHPQQRDGDAAPALTESQIKLLPRTHHLQLTRDPAVYEQIKHWCAAA